MTRCNDYQGVLLDYLYGLLDPADATAVEEHLNGCGDCTTARDQAARTQGLFARAAKVEFPNVRFVAPTVEPAPAPTRRKPAWAGWAVAASVLLAVGGVAGTLGTAGRDYDDVRTAAAVAIANSEYARKTALNVMKEPGPAALAEKHAAAKKKHDELLAAWLAAEKQAEDADKGRTLLVDVIKPAAVQPGAPNDFLVALGGTLAPGTRVEAAIRDQANNVLRTWPVEPRKNADDPGKLLHLPADVWGRVGPRSELFLTVAVVDAAGTRTEIVEPVRLFGPVYATMLATDRPAYRPGDRVFFRSLTLDRTSFRPPDREQVFHYDLRKAGAKADATPVGVVAGRTGLVRVEGSVVEPVLGPDGQPVRGVGCGAFAVPADLPDGEYVLTLTEVPGPGGVPPAVAFPVTRTIAVRSAAAERFAKEVGFGKASYSGGDVVEAWVEVRSEGKPLPGVEFAAVATADDAPQTVVPNASKTDATGRGRVRFRLPEASLLPRGDVRVKFTVALPGGGSEEVAGRVPVVGRGVVVEFFPEGGKLVAGVPSRVYVRATTPGGLPVELKGAITDGREVVARVETLNDPDQPGANRGLGAFTFTPRLGADYWLQPLAPAAVVAPLLPGPVESAPAAVLGTAAARGVRTGFLLPRADFDGVVMSVPDAVTSPGQPIRVQLHATGKKPRGLVVGAYTRGRLADTQRVTVEPGTPVEVTLLANDDPRGGVTRITVFEEPAKADAELIPVAERLVFRRPGEKLNLAVTPGTNPFDIGIAATDENGRPKAAVVWAAVTNAANPPGPRDRLLPTHFLLAGETRTPDQLEHADFLLTDHPKAAISLDLVLGTQGWRRFAEQTPPRALVSRPGGSTAGLIKDAERVAVGGGQFPVQFDTSAARERHRRLTEHYRPGYEAAARELDEAERAKNTAECFRTERVRQLLNAYATQRQGIAEVAARADAAAEPLGRWRWIAVSGLGVVALVLGVFVFRAVAVLPFSLSGASSSGLAAYLAFWVPGVDPVAVPDAVEVPAAVALIPEEVLPLGVKGPPGQPDYTPQWAKGIAGTQPQVQSIWQPGREDVRPVPNGLFDVRKPLRGPVVGTTNDAASQTAATAVGKRAANELRAIGGFARTAGADAGLLDRVRESIPREPPLVVREYAAERPTDPAADGPDTILWQPVIVLPTDGKVVLSLPQVPVTGGYQVMVAGHTPDGRIGATRVVLPVRR